MENERFPVRNIVGVDPSFTRTGLCHYDSEGDVCLHSISHGGSVYRIDECMHNGFLIACDFRDWLLSRLLLPVVGDSVADASKVPQSAPEGVSAVDIVYEYPVLASKSGPYLGLLMSKMDSLMKSLICRGYVRSIIYVPSMAVPGITGLLSKDKGMLVEFAHQVVGGRYNHDEATAIVLSVIGAKVLNGTYRKSYYRVFGY